MNAESFSARARLFVRHDARYEARLEPHPDHADQFRLSYPDAQNGLAVIDVSEGGLGLKSSVFLPKNLRLILHIYGTGAKHDSLGRELTIRAVVRRCSLIDHKPNYQVGLQFLDPMGVDEQHLIRDAVEPRAAAAAIRTGGEGVAQRV
jgi:hypothetical protein